MVCLLPAQAAAERVTSFDSVLTVQTDGQLMVQETIVYDFEDAWRPGIYRDLATHSERTGADILLQFNVIDVTDEVGRSVRFRTQDLGPIRRISIGDPRRMTTGSVQYVLHYTARGALVANGGVVELAWHVNGPDWTVPVDSLSAEVHVPSLSSSDVRANCLLGGYGEFEGECQQSVGGALRFEAPGGVPAGNSMALFASFPNHIITAPSSAERWQTDIFAHLRVWMLAPLMMFLSLLLRRAVAARPIGGKHAVARSAPPVGLRPAQAGVIWDDRFDMDDVSATLIDLAVRGHIEISQDLVRDRSRLSARQFRVTRQLQPGDELEKFESLLMEAVFELSNSVLTSGLNHRLYTEHQALEDAVYASVVPGAFSENPRLIQRRYGSLGGVLIVLGLFSLALSFPYALEIASALASSGTVVLLMSPLMPARTRRGAKIRSELQGLRSHLELSVERRDLHDFERLLPFALVLGAADPWIERFQTARHRPKWLLLTSGQPSAARFADTLGRFVREISLYMSAPPSGPGAKSEGGHDIFKPGGDW